MQSSVEFDEDMMFEQIKTFETKLDIANFLDMDFELNNDY